MKKQEVIEQEKLYRGRLSQRDKNLLIFLCDRAEKMLRKKHGIGIKNEEIEMRIPITLIPWSPALFFGSTGKEGIKWSRALRSLEKKGYVTRFQETKQSPTSYTQLTHDGLLIAQTWKSYQSADDVQQYEEIDDSDTYEEEEEE